MRLWCLGLLVVVGCVQSNAIQCQLGDVTWTCPSQAKCNPAQIGCVTQDQLDLCMGQTDGTPCMIDSARGVCVGTVCEVSTCGDGFIIAPEQCEPGPNGGVANVHACV